MNIVLSSRQVADILGVNESSVKRWADNGMLSCYKTPGGHRKFKKEDLLIFSNKYSFELKSDISINLSENTRLKDKNIENINSLLFKKLLVSSEDEITDYLYSLYLSGTSIIELYDYVIAKTMSEIGWKWKKKELTIDQEHIATNKIINSLIRLNDKITSLPFKGFTALCGSFEGEFHELPLLSVRNVLTYHGWKVIYVGVNTPCKAMQSSIIQYQPDIICLSSTIVKNKETFISDIKKLHAVSKSSGSKLLIGGSGINELKNLPLKADATINSTGQLIKFLKNNFPF